MAATNPSVRYLQSLLGSIRKESFGLERMRLLVAELHHPEKSPGIVHIAGTNGKGSTAAMIESGLLAEGRTVGLYTSPHLSRINERFRISGREVCDETLAEAIEPVRRANERVVAKHGRSAHPTFFESVTAVALVLFRQAGLEHMIIETGLGGRLDASNVVRSELAVITRVNRDHEQYLGLDLAGIAAEKAAIAKPGCRAVMGPQAAPAREALLRCFERAKVDVIDVEAEWKPKNASSEAGRWRFAATSRDMAANIELAMAGKHQVENALTAVASLHALRVPCAQIAEGVSKAQWPGRLEFASNDPPVLLDAAHNPDGARALAEFLGREARGRKVTLIYGSSRDKAVDEVAAWLFPAADRVVLTRSSVARAASPETLMQTAGHHHAHVETADDIGEALRLASAAATREDWIVVAGSIFLVGEARELLG